MSELVLRPYQVECVDAIVRSWATSHDHIVVKLPTGAGKTVVFASLVEQMTRGAHRALILVNRDELVRQTVDKLKAVAPDIRIGIVQGDSDQWRERVVVASIQTISRQARLDRIPADRFAMVIADEMQYSAAPSWQRVLAYFAAPMVVGVSATPERSDRKGLGDYWHRVVFERDVHWAIEQGYLVDAACVRSVVADLDLDSVKQSGGDFQDKALGDAMMAAHAAEAVATAYLSAALGPDGLPRRGVVFAPTVEAASNFADAFNAAGIRTEAIFGHTPVHERQAAYRNVRTGATRVLASVMVLAVGFDLPAVEVAVMARPTKSRALYIQQAGRVLRPSPDTGKQSALILDVVGVSRLGLASFADLGTTPPDPEVVERERIAALPREEQEIETIYGAIDLRPVDLISGKSIFAVAKRDREAAWHWTDAKLAYLRPNSTFEHVLYVTFVGLDAEGWVAQNGKRTAQVVARGSIDAVMRTLVDWHPGDPPALQGPITEKQLAWLGDGCAEMTKQEASDEITKRAVSRRLASVGPSAGDASPKDRYGWSWSDMEGCSPKGLWEARCARCKGAYETFVATLNRGARHYCGRDCQREDRRAESVAIVCRACGSARQVVPSRAHERAKNGLCHSCEIDSKRNRHSVTCPGCKQTRVLSAANASGRKGDHCRHCMLVARNTAKAAS